MLALWKRFSIWLAVLPMLLLKNERVMLHEAFPVIVVFNCMLYCDM